MNFDAELPRGTACPDMHKLFLALASLASGEPVGSTGDARESTQNLTHEAQQAWGAAILAGLEWDSSDESLTDIRDALQALYTKAATCAQERNKLLEASEAKYAHLLDDIAAHDECHAQSKCPLQQPGQVVVS